MSIKVIQIVARGKNGVIGNNGDIPWKLPGDLKYFKENTLGHICIVGRKTYETIKHLKGRKFIVVSRSGITRIENGVIYSRDIDTAICMAKLNANLNKQEKVFVIGGGEIYRLATELTTNLLVTEVNIEIEGDAYYHIPDGFELIKSENEISENDISYKFTEYQRTTK